jgi:hypothetical protein
MEFQSQSQDRLHGIAVVDGKLHSTLELYRNFLLKRKVPGGSRANNYGWYCQYSLFSTTGTGTGTTSF